MTKFLDKSSKTIDILRVFFEPKGSPISHAPAPHGAPTPCHSHYSPDERSRSLLGVFCSGGLLCGEKEGEGRWLMNRGNRVFIALFLDRVFIALFLDRVFIALFLDRVSFIFLN